MEYLTITELNDFVFCPASIYFHNVYQNKDSSLFYSTDQYNGLAAHSTIDKNTYSTRKDVLSGIEVFSEKYQLSGKIDIFFVSEKKLMERKKKVKKVYDGYIYQLYGEYFGLTESGYDVETLVIHSLDDNKTYNVLLPQQDLYMLNRFNKLINDINNFDINQFAGTESSKCCRCIYSNVCDFNDNDEQE